jgi:hypothetical protein
MRTVFDELEGLLGKDEIARIKADSGLTRRLEKGDEMFRVYDEETDEQEERETRRTESRTEERRESAGGDQSLVELTKTLQGITAKLSDVPTKADMDSAIKKGGEELFNNMSGRLLRQSDELNRIYRRHEREFSEEFDSPKFEAFVEEQSAAGKRFDSITDAYEKFTGERREEARVESKVREKLKERANQNQGNLVPGVTPPGSKSPIATFMKRGRETDATGGTAVDRAGAALEAALAAKSSEA